MFLKVHAGLAALVVLSGLAVILYALHGVVRRRAHDKGMKNLALGFRSAMDVALISGIVLIMTGFGFQADVGVHVILMLLATAVSHVVPAVMRRRPQAERTLLPYAVATLVALALAAFGVLSIPGLGAG